MNLHLAPWLLALLPAWTAAVELTAAERAYLEAKGPIRACVATDWAPMESVDGSGRHIGIGADFLRLMAERGGFELAIVHGAHWAETVEIARRRECDIFSMAMASPERMVYMDFTDPYVVIPSVVATRTEAPYIASIEAVLDKPLGHMRGFAGLELLRARYPGIRLVEVDSYEEGLARVQARELYGMVGNMASISMTLQQNKIADLKIAGWVGIDSRMSVGTRNDEPELGRIFRKLVDSIEPQDSQAIMNRWLAVRFEQGFDYRLFWRAMAVVLLIAIVVTVWLRQLRRLNRQLREANDRLAEAGRRDALTGLHNRLYLDQKLEHCLRACRRHGLPLALAVIDLDHFKDINDRYGHPFGDASLRHLAGILTAIFRRDTDLTARYGGEEFIVLLEGTAPEDAAGQLEALRRSVESTPVEFDGRSAQLTVSIGLYAAVPQPGDDAMTLLKAADEALYRAKAAGRNRLVVHQTQHRDQPSHPMPDADPA
ncbi:MAG TPA: diguanylate cyclase [Xanthomonadaceae bacterium]|nr:diguanylate cyclase [Xanthomonadaceae bacterium]